MLRNELTFLLSMDGLALFCAFLFSSSNNTSRLMPLVILITKEGLVFGESVTNIKKKANTATSKD